MNPGRVTLARRWAVAACALTGIVAVYRLVLRVNPTTVALTLLVLVLLLAARWGLRYAVTTAIAATICYNFFFLPPVGTFTINDPQNWLALIAFLATAVVGSRLSERAREEADEARTRQHEVEVLFTLSRDLLQTENVATLLNVTTPAAARATGARGVLFYLLDGDRVYQAGEIASSEMDILSLRQLALTLPAADTLREERSRVPLRVGVRPRGLLVLMGVTFSLETLEAIGSLVSIAIDRAQALEQVTRGEAAKESERLRTLMIDSITHELRTPLTAIKGSATALLSSSGGMGEGERRDLLVVIDEESDRLNRLISQAVEMRQLESQEVHMAFSAVGVGELVERAVEECSGMLGGRDLRLNVPDLPKVSADETYIVKVLCNLLENASKYSDAGSPVFVSAERRGEDVVAISVADRGVGIDGPEQALIFDRFYRASAQRNHVSGTGMGLAISRAIVEAHHGSISVTSQVGQGSVFTVTLPVASGRGPYVPAPRGTPASVGM